MRRVCKVLPGPILGVMISCGGGPAAPEQPAQPPVLANTAEEAAGPQEGVAAPGPWPEGAAAEVWAEWIELSVAAARAGRSPDAHAFAERHGLDSGELISAVDLGHEVHQLKGCIACHSTDGSAGVAPSHADVWVRTTSGSTHFSDGTTIFDHMGPGKTYESPQAYLRHQMIEPTSLIVDGYKPVMPPFAGQLSDHDIDALIAYFRSL